jgi:4-aminobutyrate aminotransferase-like enzyme
VPDIITLGNPMGNGYPVAGLAVPNTLEEEGLYTLKDQYPSIVEIRGAGLFIGLELG